MGQVALKRPAVGHFLAASDSRPRNPREHEAFGEAILVHPGHVPCPDQCATREEVLKREDPGALLEALGGDAVTTSGLVSTPSKAAEGNHPSFRGPPRAVLFLHMPHVYPYRHVSLRGNASFNVLFSPGHVREGEGGR